ncbi:MAG TPA: thioredoxin domain-containing protein [Myxococcaceae bacterium]|nr:thioredoxin domain-containing protein [Myxococcaceae bacterium]
MSAVVLTGATCERNTPGATAQKPAASSNAAAPAPSSSAEGERRDGGSGDGAGEASLVLSGIPGLDFSQLPPAAQRELAAVFTDEFCYCGCPHALGACLKQHTACRHAKRMAILAAGEAANGTSSTEIINLLSRYYLSFRERVSLKADPRLCRGKPDAKVTMIEFSDFECPYCAAAAPILEAFVDKQPDVRFCYSAYPLQSHPNAMPAAQAALFARDQGKFWQMHDALFAQQTSLSREKIVEIGARVGLDRAKLQKALESGQYLEEIQASREAGRAAGLEATPTVYVNGRKLLLSLVPEVLRHTVDDEIEWVANGGKWAED